MRFGGSGWKPGSRRNRRRAGRRDPATEKGADRAFVVVLVVFAVVALGLVLALGVLTT